VKYVYILESLDSAHFYVGIRSGFKRPTHSPTTAFNRSRNATISSFIADSSATVQAEAARMAWGTLLPCSEAPGPGGVSAISTCLHPRSSGCAAEMGCLQPLQQWVRVPESRNNRSPTALTGQSIAFPQHQHHQILGIGQAEPIEQRLVDAVEGVRGRIERKAI